VGELISIVSFVMAVIGGLATIFYKDRDKSVPMTVESPDPNDHLLERILLSVKELWVYPVEFPEGNPIQLG
jgi:hypothetical protein